MVRCHGRMVVVVCRRWRPVIIRGRRFENDQGLKPQGGAGLRVDAVSLGTPDQSYGALVGRAMCSWDISLVIRWVPGGEAVSMRLGLDLFFFPA